MITLNLKGQFATWNAHGAVAIFVPVVLGMWFPIEYRLLAIALVSTGVLAFYERRERLNKKSKQEAGTWDGHHHMDEAGVTGPIDEQGDILGPRVAFLMAWLLTLVMWW